MTRECGVTVSSYPRDVAPKSDNKLCTMRRHGRVVHSAAAVLPAGYVLVGLCTVLPAGFVREGSRGAECAIPIVREHSNRFETSA